MADYPYIRDTIVLNPTITAFCRTQSGAGPMFLLARKLSFEPGFVLRVEPGRSLVIIADEVDGRGGAIEASAVAPVTNGVDGRDGANGQGTLRFGLFWPRSAGKRGTAGTGGSQGGSAGHVTVRARRVVGLHIQAIGGDSGSGGNGGRGGNGVNGFTVDPTSPAGAASDDGNVWGTPGGRGGVGGKAGIAGAGGTVVVTTLADDGGHQLVARAGATGRQGRNGQNGSDGQNLRPPEEAPQEWDDPDAAPRGDAPPTVSPAPVLEIVAEDRLRDAIRADLGRYLSWWMLFRIAVGEYFHALHNPYTEGREDKERMAIAEYETVRWLDPVNAEAEERLALILGWPERQPNGEVIWKGGGNNAIGLPRDLDVLPRFDEYMRAYANYAGLAQTLANLAAGTAMSAAEFGAFRLVVENSAAEARAAAANGADDAALARREQLIAGEELKHAKAMLAQAEDDIRASLAEMASKPFSLGEIVGFVASVAGAVVAVIAAVPSGGASAVGLAPALTTFTKTLMDTADPLVRALVEPDADDIKTLTKAYEGVGKKVDSVIKATQAVVNLVKVADKLLTGSNPDNAKYVALLRRGAELAHQALVAGHRGDLADQRAKAAEARVGRARDLADIVAGSLAALTQQDNAIRIAGLRVMQVAAQRLATIHGFSFRALRSLEILTLEDQGRRISFEGGLIHPDIARAYTDNIPGFNDPTVFTVAVAQSWGKLLDPALVEQDFRAYFGNPGLNQNILRRSLRDAPVLATLRESDTLAFRLDIADIPANHRDAKVRNVWVALVGARSPSGVVSCEVRRPGLYQQRRPDGSVLPQTLRPLVTTVVAPTAPLQIEPPSPGGDPVLEVPQALPFWGRGLAGDWDVSVLREREEADLRGLTEVQVWVAYQFLRAAV